MTETRSYKKETPAQYVESLRKLRQPQLQALYNQLNRSGAIRGQAERDQKAQLVYAVMNGQRVVLPDYWRDYDQ